MKELVIISGKGGAGKTSITASLVALAGKSVIVDADVDAADMHLVLPPRETSHYSFEAGFGAVMDASRCTGCGYCREICQFSAINSNYEIDPILCEGCGVCAHFCPAEAISMERKTCGNWFVSKTSYGTMMHARLFPGEESSGLLVSRLRQEARSEAEKSGIGLCITDGPPGIGCPVIASITGADLVLAVAEPTISGIHDVKRVKELAGYFKIPVVLCINKSGLNPEMENEFKKWAAMNSVPVAGEIPYDRSVTDAMIAGRTIIEHSDSKPSRALRLLWDDLKVRLGQGI